jgi:ABC-type phosphate transport system substrate-binding protein
MNPYYRYLCVVLSALALAVPHAVSADSNAVQKTLAVVVHKSSLVDGISAADLRKVLTGELRAWPDARQIVVIEQPDENATQQRMLQAVLKATPAAYNRQLLQVQFQGRPMPVIRVLNSDMNAIAFVWNVPGAVSIVEMGAAAASATHVKILKIDGKLPGEAGYLLQ